jgi:hypothetical protein
VAAGAVPTRCPPPRAPDPPGVVAQQRRLHLVSSAQWTPEAAPPYRRRRRATIWPKQRPRHHGHLLARSQRSTARTRGPAHDPPLPPWSSYFKKQNNKLAEGI